MKPEAELKAARTKKRPGTLLRTLAVSALAAAFMTAAAFSAFALPEETEAPSGDVVVRPEIAWTDSREFSMDCLVTNESGMMIPETEIILTLPEGSGLYFEDNGRKEKISVERNELKAEEQFSFTLKGGREIEGAGSEGSSPGRMEAEESAFGEGTFPEETSEEDAEAEDELLLRMDIVLRGYGLVHPTKAFLSIPPAPEPEVKVPVFRYRIVADLQKTGADEEAVLTAETSEYERNFGFRADGSALEGGKHRLHFRDLNGADRIKGRKLFAWLAGLFICIVITRMLWKGMEKKEIGIIEQQRHFRRMK